eukprot:GHRR01030584.1.p1 GENE.GHRR01030584.1~~GHRR01030584.1.p1  ORF type:complete len:151 (+),score=46.52 GHRR01030584.1:536-988(+)
MAEVCAGQELHSIVLLTKLQQHVAYCSRTADVNNRAAAQTARLCTLTQRPKKQCWLLHTFAICSTQHVKVSKHCLLSVLQEKGIRKRKRSKLVFDEDAQEWRRRHGYKKANDAEAVPVIEAKATDMVCIHCNRFWLMVSRVSAVGSAVAQ